MKMRMLLLWAVLAMAGGAACESKYIGGWESEGGGGGTGDGDQCQLGNTKCLYNSVFKCKQASSGQATWIQHQVCTTHQMCKHQGGAATCIALLLEARRQLVASATAVPYRAMFTDSIVKFVVSRGPRLCRAP